VETEPLSFNGSVHKADEKQVIGMENTKYIKFKLLSVGLRT
jgi:hypothetical protein